MLHQKSCAKTLNDKALTYQETITKMSQIHTYDAIIIGAGAAGLMCALQAGKRGKRILLLDHAENVGAKILLSGGGRCNFTNKYAAPDRYISDNKHFCIYALKGFTQDHFVKMIKEHDITYHEKKLGQLFCDGSASQITSMLEDECEKAKVTIKLNCTIQSVKKLNTFTVKTNQGLFSAHALIIATGGLSIPKVGATNFALNIADQFGISVTPTRPGLVPLTFKNDTLCLCKKMRGISIDVIAATKEISFRENMLFTHRGLSGPAILQLSSHLKEGDEFSINLLPNCDAKEFLLDAKEKRPKATLKTILSEHLPQRFSLHIATQYALNGPLGETSNKKIEACAAHLNHWSLRMCTTEGYDKAEVTVGGISSHALSSKSMESKDISGLYFIGETVDVTGWLGGYNLQWAWSSGFAAAFHL